jgi:hypothetical protein
MVFKLHNMFSHFKTDQNVLINELKFVETMIEESATEMAMIAAESVFDEQVSTFLVGEARALHRMVRGLEDLRLEIDRARLPRKRKKSSGA